MKNKKKADSERENMPLPETASNMDVLADQDDADIIF
jgi:hypothetical protein